MRKINLKYVVKSGEQFAGDLKKIISVFTSDSDVHLEINLFMGDVDCTTIKQVIDGIAKCKTFKDIHNENIYTFILTISPKTDIFKSILKIKNLITRIDLVYENNKLDKFLLMAVKKKLPCNIVIRESAVEKIYELYKRISKYGYPIHTDSQIEYDGTYKRLLNDWIYDKNGSRLNIFTDVLSRILLDYWGTKCQYKSCITKYFSVDNRNGKIYACKDNEVEICDLAEIESLQDIYSKEPFIELLKSSIVKREKCSKGCGHFAICLGGCALKSKEEIEECKDKLLFSIIDDLTCQIKKIVNDGDYSELNPAFRDMILSSLSSNKVFEKGLVL